jgi:hypothetical protein
LASILAAGIRIMHSNSLSLISLRDIAIGFDPRVFHALFACGGAMDCHRPWTGQQEDERREAETTARVIRIRINRI